MTSLDGTSSAAYAARAKITEGGAMRRMHKAMIQTGGVIVAAAVILPTRVFLGIIGGILALLAAGWAFTRLTVYPSSALDEEEQARKKARREAALAEILAKGDQPRGETS